MSAHHEPVITVEHLHKRYGETIAVEDVSFEVLDDEIFGIIGPNGAGKTTTVECLQGLRSADGGRIQVLGLNPARQVEQLRLQIGSQFQASSLPDRIRVGEALTCSRVRATSGRLETLAGRMGSDRTAQNAPSATSPAARSNGSFWPWPLSTIPSSSSLTSLPRDSTRRRAAHLGADPRDSRARHHHRPRDPLHGRGGVSV